MLEEISQSGLKSYLFQLQGKITYTLVRPQHSPKTNTVDTTNYSDTAINHEDGTIELKPGKHATAHGLSVHIMKNDRKLDLDFEGYDGQYYHWTFQGLNNPEGVHQASQGVQTAVTQAKAVDSGSQTDMSLEPSTV
ncbi:hypothetical protein DPSP01_001458 [Paraphaeosphaeria sporulosa]